MNRASSNPSPRLLLLFLMLVSSGCSSPGRVVLSVRDGSTLSPIAGAKVSSSPMKFFVPVYPYQQLSPFPIESSNAVTGTDGLAYLEITRDQPSRLSVWSPGHTRFLAVLEYAGPDDAGVDRWTMTGTSPPAEAEDSRLIIRVVDAESRR